MERQAAPTSPRQEKAAERQGGKSSYEVFVGFATLANIPRFVIGVGRPFLVRGEALCEGHGEARPGPRRPQRRPGRRRAERRRGRGHEESHVGLTLNRVASVGIVTDRALIDTAAGLTSLRITLGILAPLGLIVAARPGVLRHPSGDSQPIAAAHNQSDPTRAVDGGAEMEQA